MDKKYFLDQDHSSYWYIIDAKHRNDWNEWLDLDENDERAWQAPDFAKKLGRYPNNVEFTNYKILGEIR